MKKRSYTVNLIISSFRAQKNTVIQIISILVILSIVSGTQPYIIKQITDNGIIKRQNSVLIIFVAMLLGLKIVESVAEIIKAKKFANMHNAIVKTLNDNIVRKLLRCSIRYYEQRNGTEIISAMNADINMVSSICDDIIDSAISQSVQITAGLVGLMLINKKLAFVIVVLIPVKFFIAKKFSRKRLELAEQYLMHSYEYDAWLGEQFDNIKDIKLWNLNVKKIELNEIKINHLLQLKKIIKIWEKYYTSSGIVVDALLNCSMFLIGGWMIFANQISEGSFLAFVAYTSYILAPITLLANIKYYFSEVKPSLWRIEEFLHEKEEIYDFDEIYDVEIKDAENAIKFSDVSFSHIGREKEVLHNVSFVIKKGEKVAIIGENGVGKSTLLNLLVGFYLPDSGEISVFGKTVNQIGVEQLRQTFSVLEQLPRLFNESIKGNIDLEDKRTYAEVQEICKMTRVDDFTKKFSNQYEQKIGSNGVTLSGGERQKIAMTRAAIKDAEIIVLDEPLNNCDSAMQIKDVLQFFPNKTVLVITHDDDLSEFDQVFRIADGQLVRER